MVVLDKLSSYFRRRNEFRAETTMDNHHQTTIATQLKWNKTKQQNKNNSFKYFHRRYVRYTV